MEYTREWDGTDPLAPWEDGVKEKGSSMVMKVVGCLCNHCSDGVEVENVADDAEEKRPVNSAARTKVYVCCPQMGDEVEKSVEVPVSRSREAW